MLCPLTFLNLGWAVPDLALSQPLAGWFSSQKILTFHAGLILCQISELCLLSEKPEKGLSWWEWVSGSWGGLCRWAAATHWVTSAILSKCTCRCKFSHTGSFCTVSLLKPNLLWCFFFLFVCSLRIFFIIFCHPHQELLGSSKSFQILSACTNPLLGTARNYIKPECWPMSRSACFNSFKSCSPFLFCCKCINGVSEMCTLY